MKKGFMLMIVNIVRENPGIHYREIVENLNNEMICSDITHTFCRKL